MDVHWELTSYFHYLKSRNTEALTALSRMASVETATAKSSHNFEQFTMRLELINFPVQFNVSQTIFLHSCFLGTFSLFHFCSAIM